VLVMDNATREVSPSTGLRGRLGVLGLVLTVIAYNGPMAVLAGFIPVVIGAGSGLASPLIYVLIGILLAIFAVGLNAMAARMTHAGAFYTYITAGLGRHAGLSAGVIAMLAYLGLASGTYILFALGMEAMLGRSTGSAAGIPWLVWAIGAWGVGSFLTLRNVSVSAKVVGVLSAAEVIIILIWQTRVFFNGGPEGRVFNATETLGSGSIALALVFGILCCTGFESLQVFRSETRNPSRTVPTATYVAVGVIVALNVVSAYVYIVSFGATNAVAAAADPTGSVMQSIATYIGAVAADIANALLVTSAFAACLAIQSILARYVFAFGRDGIFPQKLGVANEKHGSPARAAGATSVVVLLVFLLPGLLGAAALPTFTALLGIGGYLLIILWAVTSVAVVMFMRSIPSARPGAWQSVIAPSISALGLGAIAVLSTVYFDQIVAVAFPGATVILMAVAVIAVGAAVSAEVFRRRSPDVYRAIGQQQEFVSSPNH
jgi:amino acid transporter